MVTRQFLHALYIAVALLFAPLVMAEPMSVSYGVSDSMNSQSMQDTKACMACHVAPGQKRQRNSTEYKVKTSHVIGGGSSNISLIALNVETAKPYTEVGWQIF